MPAQQSTFSRRAHTLCPCTASPCAHLRYCCCRLCHCVCVPADAEMLWCQAVGALFVGMLSELVYTSILGMLGGMAYGERGGACLTAQWFVCCRPLSSMLGPVRVPAWLRMLQLSFCHKRCPAHVRAASSKDNMQAQHSTAEFETAITAICRKTHSSRLRCVGVSTQTGTAHCVVCFSCAVVCCAGFCMGYVGAIKGSVRLVSGVSCRLLSKAVLVGMRLLRRAMRVVARV